MKILAICPGAYISGVERVTIQVLKEFQKRDFKIVCVINGWNNGQFPKELEKINQKYIPIKLGWIYKSNIWWTASSLIHLVPGVIKFMKIKIKNKFDIVYVSSYRPVILLYPFLGNNIVFHIHDTYGEDSRSKFFFRLIDKKIKSYIAVSEFIKNDIVNLGILPDKIKVIYNGVDTPQKELNSTTSNSIINLGIVGQIIPRKGHKTLFMAINIIKQKHPEIKFKLLIYGTGTSLFEETLRKVAYDIGIEEYLDWRGFENEIEKIYEEIDILIVPTENEEAFGLIAAEAGIRGIPVIASKSGGLKEIIDHNITGLLFEIGDEKSLADNIISLLLNPNRINVLGSNARLNIEKKFSKKNKLSELINFLQEE